jgi:hypothetical protein
MNRPEQDLQRQVVQWLRLVKPNCLGFHPPMGGWRSKKEAAIMAGLGARAGIGDLVFLWGDGSGMIELKRPDGKGRQTEKQAEVEDECKQRDIPYVIATRLEEVEDSLVSWGRLRRRLL